MNIPLDCLYRFVDTIASEIYGDCIIIYRFWPHGSKNINNLTNLYKLEPDWYKKTIFPLIWCNDQEPLDYEFYKTQTEMTNDFASVLKSNNIFIPPKNLNFRNNIFEKGILLHSEKRSRDLKKYQLDDELIPVYYWSHGIIARDWFRYAEHVTQKKQVQKTFLIYNRAWSGTREYRLQFIESLIEANLQDCCQTTVSPIEPELGVHYNTYQFKNSVWKPTCVLENFFPSNTVPSHYSAEFDIADYEATDIEVVLETLFDDTRLHLTEKSLRPIACGQPFILAGTYGSLEYLRSYGFKTFGHIWDEQYDLTEDPKERLIQIADLMTQITNWAPGVREKKLDEAQAIADYNKQHFFSRQFFNVIVNELKINLKTAFYELKQYNNYQSWIDRWNHYLSYPEVTKYLNANQNLDYPTMEYVKQAMKLAQSQLTEIAIKK